MSEITPKVEFALICDDVRREDSGKLLAIGIYATNIRLASFPTRVTLSLMLGMKSDEPGTAKFDVVIFLGRERVVEGHGEAKFDTAGYGIFPLRGIPIEFKEPTNLDVRIKIGDGRLRSVKKLAIDGPED